MVNGMPLAPVNRFEKLRKKAPQIVVGAIAVAIIAFLLLEVLEDVVIEGAPISGLFGEVVGLVVAFTQNVTGTVASWGYAGVFVLMLFESTSLPIPSEVVLPFAGYLVSLGSMDFWGAVAVSTVAGVLGSLVDYYIGWKGAHVLSEHRILGKVFLSEKQLGTAVHWFNRHGSVSVFFSRLIPGFRTIVSFPAGAVRMPMAKFFVFTTAGCFVWNVLLIYVGVFLGERWREVAGVPIYYFIIATALAAATVFVWYLLRRRKRRQMVLKAGAANNGQKKF